MFTSNIDRYSSILMKEKPFFFIGSVVLSFLTAIFNLLSIIILIAILAIVFEAQFLNSTSDHLGLWQYIFNLSGRFSQINYLFFFILVLCLIVIFKNCLAYLGFLVDLKHKRKLRYQLKTKILDLLCHVKVDYYQKHKIGDIVFQLNREIERSILNIISCQTIYSLGLIICFFTCLLLVISWQLTVIFFLVFCLLTIVNNLAIAKVKKTTIASAHSSKIYTRKLIEFLTGIKLIKTVGNESQELLNINRELQDKEELQYHSQSLAASIKPLNELAKIAICLLMLAIATNSSSQTIPENAPNLLIYSVILFRLFPLIAQLNNARHQFELTTASRKKVANFLAKSENNLTDSGSLSVTEINSEIEFKNITFAYPDRNQIILDKINLRIYQGETTAIFGVSNPEKSAIIELLIRFYEPIDGQILLDRHNIAKYNLIGLRKSIAIISNDTFLFSNSLAYNLAYGLDNITEIHLTRVLVELGLESLVAELPQGLATPVGTRGVILTEVQKYQVAIARAKLRNPALLIVDESSIPNDVFAQPSIAQAIAKLGCDRTTLTITNRLTTLKNADRVIVFSKGTVIESGTHAELLHQGDFYHRWYANHFRSSQKTYQQKLVQKIAKKLASQTNVRLSAKIHQHTDELLSYIHLIQEGAYSDEIEAGKILDESYQSAKDMLDSLREYEQKLERKIDPDLF